MLFLGLMIVAAPASLVAAIGLSMLFGRPMSERGVARLTQLLVSTGFLAAAALLVMMLSAGQVRYTLELGRWVDLPAEHFHFTIKFLFDRLSIPFVILTLALCGTIGAFASRYLHRDEGYMRFFLLYAIFLLGMVVSAVAGTIETLFLGWELVGLSSALLVAFFQNRINPVANGLRVWTIYRFADGAFLLAALVLHHLTGGGDLDLMMGEAPWPESVCPISPLHALIVGTLLLVAAAGKSALVPFSGWLPRAMEGPTPSSAIFYGALSVHLGAYLLLRVGPMLDRSITLQVMVIGLGAITAIYAAIAVGVQTDVKSALAFASLLQVSIIVVEIGLGFRYLALIHIIGHASMRTLQLLRAPSMLRDYRQLEDNLGYSIAGRVGKASGGAASSEISPLRLWCYRLAMERGHFDTVLDERIGRPFVRLFGRFDSWERRWNGFVSGRRGDAVSGRDAVSVVVDEAEVR
jgi:NADH-quinone oxidoreductase subunit L